MFLAAGLSCALCCALVSVDPPPDGPADARVEALEARVAQLEARLFEPRRSELTRQELDALIADAFADAEQRAALLDDGVLAGIDEKGTIFLASTDGRSRLDISGQVQFRYIWNNQDDRSSPSSGDSVSGFDVRRAKLKLFGKVSERWSYKMIFATLRTAGPGVTPNTYTEMAQLGYKIDGRWSVVAGFFKLPFSRQELISSSRQVAVDRGVVHEFFTLNFAERVQLNYKDDRFRGQIAISDGANTTISGIPNATSSDFAITARGELKLKGGWAAGQDEFAGDHEALFLAGAVHYEQLDGDSLRNGVLADDTLVWTGELLWKTPGASLSAAAFGSHVQAVGAGRVDAYGALVQVNAVLTDDLNVFARYEILDDGSVVDSNTLDDDSDLTQAITLGFNKALSRNVRLTSDVVYLFGNDPAAVGRINGGAVSSGIGLQPGLNDDDGQLAWRTQIQLLY
ncbi:MAG: porin [Planctomycetota bacterium]